MIAEFLPDKSTESFATVRHRTLTLGKRLDENARDRAWFDPPHTDEREQIELDPPNDPSENSSSALTPLASGVPPRRTGEPSKSRLLDVDAADAANAPVTIFVTADISKKGLRLRALQALQREGYAGRGEITMLSDGAEIMKRLPRGLPRPSRHIVDWFHIAMKIQPLQQVADHIVHCRDDKWTNETVILDEEIRALKWKLWHGQVDRAIQQPDGLLTVMAMLREQGDLSAGRIWQLAQVLLTYIRQNKMAIVDYGARYRSGRRIASALAKSAVNSVAARRMVKKQQMRWSSISNA